MSRGNNLARIFSEIVSIDAWHTKFDDKNDDASVHVDLSFFEGRLGAEEESQVRFKLALTRAELVFVIPATEPLKVIQSTVDRDAAVEGIQKYMRENQTAIKNSAGAALSVSKAPKLNIGGTARRKKHNINHVITETSVPVSQFSMKQSKDVDGNYRWEITSHDGNVLVGKVWDPVKKPRLSVKRYGASAIAPTCRLIVRCRRQDLKISKIEIKGGIRNSKRWTTNKTAAASAYISQKIAELGFVNKNFDEPFIEVCLAEISVYEEIS
jgi:hypothetical protein